MSRNLSFRIIRLAAAIFAVLLSSFATGSSAGAQPLADGGRFPRALQPAIHEVPSAQQQRVEDLRQRDLARIVRKSTPVETQGSGAGPDALEDPSTAQPFAVRPVAPRTSTSGPAVHQRGPVVGNVWPGAYNANPNKQVGKLYFDTDPSARTSWSHCTATAVNSENKSTIVTAGHCVYDITNRRWYTNLWFYPGFENGRYISAWTVRTMSTTGTYFTNGAYADDMAVAVVNRDSSGVALVNRVGGHGIAFNQSVGLTRTSFGYPAADGRWPGTSYTGNDLIYCQGTDSYYSTGSLAGQHYLQCRMTGGASGGPWLSNVNSSWLGTVTSVNSNKGGVGASYADRMYAPYFGAAEQAVYQKMRAV